jgi:hypothetical protein
MRFSWLPVVVLLLVCGLPSRAAGQGFVCWPIGAGDTASSLARRLTGNSAAAYGFAFQIRDPARRMFVPKSHYQHLQPDWQACIAPGPVPSTPVVFAPEVELASSTIVSDQPVASAQRAFASAPASVARGSRTLADLPFAGPVTAVLLLALSAVAGSLTLRPMPPAVRRAGEDFATVFARPLIDPSSEIPPIQTRLRYKRRTRQLEIFMAPGPGHRYPNLADHKNNVEYDIDRVMRVLGTYVLSRPPRAVGNWVVVTIQSSQQRSGNDVLGLRP